ncbi:MAG: HNH endonuclease, partial [Clostridia bacterium]|nr:HNH endonuclease [Clostridia bacterium]
MARPFAKPFYRSKEWEKVRQYVIRRDKYLCQKCGSPAEEVHHKIHLSPENINDPEIALSPDNLVSLCRDCH